MLLVDIGNTYIKIGAKTKVGVQLLGTVLHKELTNGVLCDIYDDCFGQRSSNDQTQECVISCVGPQNSLELILDWIEENLNCNPKVAVVDKSSCGLINHYADIDKLGVDRWVAAIGAISLYPDTDTIVIDAGTAITIDYIQHNKGYLGGVILPGHDLMQSSLVSKTVGIHSELDDVTNVIGKNTQECVNSGISYGLPGAVERIVSEMLKEQRQQCKVLLTGGGAVMLDQNLTIDVVNTPLLMFHGLERLGRQ